MDTAMVFRVEHATERSTLGPGHFLGPYHHHSTTPQVQDLTQLLLEEHNDPTSGRPIWDDEKWETTAGDPVSLGHRPDKGGYISGFRDFDQLNDWFELALRELMEEAGFVLRVYEVPRDHVFLGRKQLAFLPQDATAVATWHLA